MTTTALTGLSGLSTFIAKKFKPNFNGSFYLENASPTELPQDNDVRSVFGWFRSISVPENEKGIFGYGPPTSSSGLDHNNFTIDTDGSVSFYTDSAFNETGDVSYKNYNLVGMTWDGTTLTFYINNTFWTQTPDELATVEGAMRVGLGDNWANNYNGLFVGSIYDVGIWHRVLEDIEITALLRAGPKHYRHLPGAIYDLETSGDDEILCSNGKTLDVSATIGVGLASFWNLTETSGTRHDSAGSNNLNEIDVVANFSVTSPSETGTTIQFTDTSTPIPISWQWVFGDEIGTSTEQNPSYTYANDGNYTVTLVINGNSDLNSNQALQTVTSIANFTDNSPQNQGTATTFTDESTYPLGSWLWDFGDDSGTSTEQNPSYTYASPGTYNVMLTIASGITSVTNSVTVNPLYSYISSPLDISSYYNVIGLTSTFYSHSDDGYGLDGGDVPGNGGDNFDGTELASVYPSPNIFNTTEFVLPTVLDNATNNIIYCNGQTIPLSGSADFIFILGFAVDGPILDKQFIIHYTDSTEAVQFQDFSDWFNYGNYQNELVAFGQDNELFKINSSGDNGGGPTFIYQYSFAVDRTKTLLNLVLPSGGSGSSNANHIIIMSITQCYAVSQASMWLRADTLSALSDSDNVSTWMDVSTNGNDVIQSTGGLQPVYKENIINGHPVIRFYSPSSMILYLKFDEGSGTTIIDSSGYGNNGTINVATYSSSVPTLNFSNTHSLNFSGAYNYVSLPVTAINNISSGTICAWVNLSDNTKCTILIKQHNGVNTMCSFSIGNSANHESSNVVGALYFSATNESNLAQSIGTIPIGSWHHVAVTFTTSSAILYIDGVQDSVTSGDFSIPDDTSATNITIGDWLVNDTSSLPTNGLVDDLRVYNVSLSSGDIANLYNGLNDIPSSTSGQYLTGTATSNHYTVMAFIRQNSPTGMFKVAMSWNKFWCGVIPDASSHIDERGCLIVASDSTNDIFSSPAVDDVINWHICEGVFDGTYLYGWDTGVPAIGSGIGASGNRNGGSSALTGNGVYIGCYGISGQSLFWNGDIAEVMLFPTALSDDDREIIENYLINKYIPPQNEIQQVTLSSIPLSGTWAITAAGQTTSSLAHNISPTDLQTALNTALDGSVTSVGGWNPSELPNLICAFNISDMRVSNLLWISRSGSGTNAVNDGDLVGSFQDAFTEITGVAVSDGARGTLRLLDNGQWGIEFTYSSTGYNLITVNPIGNATLSFMASQNDLGVDARILDGGSEESNSLMSLGRGDHNTIYINSPIVADSLVDDDGFHIVTMSKSNGGNWSVWLDGVSQSVNSNNTEFGSINLGTGGSFSVEGFAGILITLVVTNSNLTTVERTAMETWESSCPIYTIEFVGDLASKYENVFVDSNTLTGIPTDPPQPLTIVSGGGSVGQYQWDFTGLGEFTEPIVSQTINGLGEGIGLIIFGDSSTDETNWQAFYNSIWGSGRIDISVSGTIATFTLIGDYTTYEITGLSASAGTIELISQYSAASTPVHSFWVVATNLGATDGTFTLTGTNGTQDGVPYNVNTSDLGTYWGAVVDGNTWNCTGSGTQIDPWILTSETVGSTNSPPTVTYSLINPVLATILEARRGQI